MSILTPHSATIRRLINERRARGNSLPADLFREPKWDMLLDLAAQEIVGRKISVTSLCLASGVPATTALRHIDDLCETGLVARRADSFDGRRCNLVLTGTGRDRLCRYFRSLEPRHHVAA